MQSGQKFRQIFFECRCYKFYTLFETKVEFLNIYHPLVTICNSIGLINSTIALKCFTNPVQNHHPFSNSHNIHTYSNIHVCKEQKLKKSTLNNGTTGKKLINCLIRKVCNIYYFRILVLLRVINGFTCGGIMVENSYVYCIKF